MLEKGKQFFLRFYGFYPKNIPAGTNNKMLKVENPYHHNFNYDFNFERTKKKIFFDVFDILRVFGAAFIIIKIGMKFPSYVIFRRTKFENNPDFMICDQAEFERLSK